MSHRRQLFTANAKPHIYQGHYFQTSPLGRAWNCAGQGHVGSGDSPVEAYRNWAANKTFFPKLGRNVAGAQS